MLQHTMRSRRAVCGPICICICLPGGYLVSAIVLGGSQAVVAAPLETLDVYAGLREVLVAYNAAYGARAR